MHYKRRVPLSGTDAFELKLHWLIILLVDIPSAQNKLYPTKTSVNALGVCVCANLHKMYNQCFFFKETKNKNKKVQELSFATQ